MYFTSSLQESSVSLIESASLLKQFRIPPEFAPAASVIVNFINLAAGLALSAVFLLHCSSPAQVAFCLALVSVPLALHFLFTLGISFMLSALYIKHRDITHILNIFFLFWLWFSPVFYFIDSFPAHIQKIFNLNIIIPYLNLYRSVFYKQTLFEYRDLFFSICLSLLSLTCGYRFFIRTESSIKKAL
jgi:ABC-2 type transport system permease protein